jgi:GTPase SAR1 family protein
MIHPATGTNLYLSGPDLPPWDGNEKNWHYFERTEVLKKLEDTLLDSTAISQVFLVGPYKVGKTSTINYLLQKYINRNSYRDKHWKIILVSQTEGDTILNITVMWCKQYIENVMARPNSDNQIWMRFWKLVNDMPGDWWDQWDELTGRLPNDQRQLFDDLGRAIRAARSGNIQGWLRHFRRCLQKDTTNVMLVFLGNSELTLISDQFQNENLGNNIVQVRILCEGREGDEGPSRETASERPGSPGFESQISSSEAKSLAQVRKIELHAFTCEEAKRFVTGEGIDPQFARVTFNIDTKKILDQVGYHPALLQIVCWWMVDDKDPSGFWDRRLEEITEHVSKLIDEKEKMAILHPERGIFPNVFNRLKGKGVIL